MAAKHFTLKFTDLTDNGAGPYSATVFLNPSTDASGGTTVATYANTDNPQLNLRGVAERALQAALNKLTIDAQAGVDALN